MFLSADTIPSLLPQRIISVVPSQTELLAYLGLDKETAGITKFCVHPEEWFRRKTRIGGTKNLYMEEIIASEPDLVLCNIEENVREQVEILAERFPVYLSDVRNLEDALQMIRDVGRLTGKANEGDELVKKINNRFRQEIFKGPTLKTLYLIWQEPFMTIGGDSFISDMLARAGLDNIYKKAERYPIITGSEMQALDPELVLLSSEPFPFKERHKAHFQKIFPNAQIVLANGEMFSWYGSRLLSAPAYFKKLRNALLA